MLVTDKMTTNKMIKESVVKIENDIKWIREFFHEHIKLQENEYRKYECWREAIEKKLNSCPEARVIGDLVAYDRMQNSKIDKVNEKLNKIQQQQRGILDQVKVWGIVVTILLTSCIGFAAFVAKKLFM